MPSYDGSPVVKFLTLHRIRVPLTSQMHGPTSRKAGSPGMVRMVRPDPSGLLIPGRNPASVKVNISSRLPSGDHSGCPLGTPIGSSVSPDPSGLTTAVCGSPVPGSYVV